MKVNTYLLISLGLILLTASCNKKLSEAEQHEKDIEIIKSYISDNNLDAQETASGLHYTIDEPGTGKHPTAHETVTVRYKGMLTNKNVFDQNDKYETSLQNVIQGWTEGIQKYKEGGEGTLLIPSRLGYGSNPTGNIPANSVLIFEIKLLDIKN